MNHRYRIYGLTLQSDLDLPGLGRLALESNSLPDLALELASQPRWVSDALRLPVATVLTRPAAILPHDPVFSVTELDCARYFLLTYGDGSRFLLNAQCNHLWGAPGPGLTLEDLCVYLFGPVMGFVLRKKGFSPLHASAASIQGHAIALVGEAGAGKSTTAAALALRGWPILCEDVCAFDEVGEKWFVRPAYPRVSLWPDSVAHLCGSSEALPLIVPGWDKHFLALDGKLAKFADRPAPLAAIYFLGPRSTDLAAPQLDSISPQDALLRLVQDTYMNWLLDRQQRAAEFDVLSRLVNTVPCFRVTPSDDAARLPRLAEILESQTLRIVGSRSYPAVGISPRNV